MASHLLTKTTVLFQASRIKPAIWVSWEVIPASASTIKRATSARSMALNERNTLNFSTPTSILPRRRIPAVSINVTGSPPTSIRVSTASRVVPGMGLTMARSSPTSLLSKEDFPAFGLPTMAILTESSSMASTWAGKELTSASSRSPVPVPCMAETGYGSPRPNSKNSAAAERNFSFSHLLTTTKIGGQRWSSTFFWYRRNIPATSRSGGVTPELPSVMNSTASASLTAIKACSRISWMKSAEPTESGVLPPWVGSMPPVSIMLKTISFHSVSATKRSRVVPGTSSTIARRSPARRLKSVLFPTLGRPTRATTGLGIHIRSFLF